MSIDEILAKEAQFMYTRAPGFSPVDGNLKHWRGSIKIKSRPNSDFILEVILTDNFPSTPPKVVSITPIKHKTVDPKTMIFNLSILDRWNSQTHIYDIINVIKGEFARKPPEDLGILKPISKPSIRLGQKNIESSSDLSERLKQLEEEMGELQSRILEKDEEITRLEGILTVHEVPRTDQEEIKKAIIPTDPDKKLYLDLEGERIAIEELVKKLEEKFESGDITVEDYSRIYKKYRRELFAINKKISEVKKR